MVDQLYWSYFIGDNSSNGTDDAIVYYEVIMMIMMNIYIYIYCFRGRVGK